MGHLISCHHMPRAAFAYVTSLSVTLICITWSSDLIVFFNLKSGVLFNTDLKYDIHDTLVNFPYFCLVAVRIILPRHRLDLKYDTISLVLSCFLIMPKANDKVFSQNISKFRNVIKGKHLTADTYVYSIQHWRLCVCISHRTVNPCTPEFLKWNLPPLTSGISTIPMIQIR